MSVLTSNLPPNLNKSADQTTDYFNTLSNTSNSYSTSSNSNDMLVAYCQEWTGSSNSGTLLASIILSIAENQNISVNDILQQLITLNKDKDSINSYITILLNLNRVGTSLLGISNIPYTNSYVQRLILP